MSLTTSAKGLAKKIICYNFVYKKMKIKTKVIIVYSLIKRSKYYSYFCYYHF